ncbi:MAG: hypothetical protein LBQ18_05425 [Campylobacteraceae bacterium]|jgi:hypothetical protein|nr:hypothetical protein [Campylobacteraceae bacterium]
MNFLTTTETLPTLLKNTTNYTSCGLILTIKIPLSLIRTLFRADLYGGVQQYTIFNNKISDQAGRNAQETSRTIYGGKGN